MNNDSLRHLARDYFASLQDAICTAVERIDGGGRFAEDHWQRPGGGGGRSRVLAEGTVFEKAGVGFSEVFGDMDPAYAKNLPGDGTAFTATGVSLVFHPRSPHVPTVHANFRFLTKGERAWFGGGADLTPYYPVLEDVKHFHQTWKNACDAHSKIVDHAKLKKDCDDYFWLPHRQEHRGVGGIFFDYLEGDLNDAFNFVKTCGESFLKAYVPIVERRLATPVTAEERWFQEYRRGRYVEFNLVYDRGTLFGLKTHGRTESILMSLPPAVRYVYDHHATAGSREALLTEWWIKPRDWLSEGAT
jgi:coproporphyrinogen III oxidase